MGYGGGGINYTYSDVTGSRVLDTVYQNTTGRLMWIFINITTDAIYEDASFKTDSATPPTTTFASIPGSNSFTYNYYWTLPVKAGDYYMLDKTSSASATINLWVEIVSSV